jgi:hypothetical protein
MDIEYRLREDPGVAREIDGVVLAFAVRVSNRILCDANAVLPGSATVGIGILDANGDRATRTK